MRITYYKFWFLGKIFVLLFFKSITKLFEDSIGILTKFPPAITTLYKCIG